MDDESFSHSSQSSFLRQPMSSTCLIDDTLPHNLLESSIDMTNMTIMSQTRIEHEEFVQNEAVIDIIEGMLDKVEENNQQENQDVTVKEFASPMQVSALANQSLNGHSDDEDDDYVSACSKRQMNESIMSVDDPMLVDSKKLKNQTLNDSIVENDENQTDGDTIQAKSNFNLSDLVEVIEDKENMDPKSPNISKSSNPDQVTNNQPATVLINFESPMEVSQMNQQQPILSPTAEPSSIHSPKRPVLTELKADLFGVIYPEDASPRSQTKDLLSMSIFATTPSAVKPIVDVDSKPINANLMDFSLMDNKVETSPVHVQGSPNASINRSIGSQQNESSMHLNTLLYKDTEEEVLTNGNESLSSKSQSIELHEAATEKLMNESVISFNSLFNQSATAIHQQTEKCQDQNSSLNNCSIISTKYLFDQSTNSVDGLDQGISNPKLDASYISPNVSVASPADSSIISTHMLFNVSANKSLDQSQIKDSSMNASKSMNSCALMNSTNGQISLIAEGETRSFESSSELITYDNFENEAKDRIQEMSFVDEEFHNEPTLPLDEVEVKVESNENIDSGAASCDEQEGIAQEAEVSFSLEDRQNLIETKLFYESKIVDLNEQIEMLQNELIERKQIQVEEQDQVNDVTFSMQDRVNLIETKLDYENKIIELSEQVELLQGQLSCNLAEEAKERQASIDQGEKEMLALNEKIQQLQLQLAEKDSAQAQLLGAQVSYDNEILALREQIAQMEISNKKQNVSMQTSFVQEDVHPIDDGVDPIDHQNEISQLKERIEQLQMEIANNKNQYEQIYIKKESVNVELQTSYVHDIDASNLNVNEMTFSDEDRNNLIETKLQYENEIISLQENIDDLQAQIALSQKQFASVELQTSIIEDSKNECKCQLTKENYEKDLQRQETQIEEMSDEIDLLKSKIAKQDTHYVGIIDELEDKIGSLRADLSSYRYKYELTLVPEHRNLKQQFEQLSMRQYDVQNENEKLKETVLDLDEQRSKLRQNVESQQTTVSQLNLTISQLESEKQKLLQQTVESQQAEQGFEATRVEFDAKISAYDQQIDTLRGRLTDLETELRLSHEEKSRLENELKEKEKYEQQLSTISQEKEKESQKIAELNDLVASKQLNIETIETQLTDLLASKNTLEAELSQLKGVHEEAITNLKEQNEALSNEVGESSKKAELFCSKVGELESQIAILQTDFEKNQKELLKITEEKNLAESVIPLKKSLEEQVIELLKANESISKQLFESGDKISEMSEEMQAISMLNEKFLSENSDLEDEKKRLEAEISSLNERLTKQAQSSNLALQLTEDFERQKSQLNEAHLKEIESQQTTVSQLNLTISQLESEKQKLLQQTVESQQAIESFEATRVEFDAKIAAYDQQIDTLRGRFTDLETELQSSHEEKSRLENELKEKEKFEQQLSIISQEKENESQKVAELNDLVASKQLIIENIETKLANLLTSKNTLEAKLSQLKGDNEEVITDLKKKNEALSNEADESSKKAELFSSKVGELESRIAILQADFEKSQHELLKITEEKKLAESIIPLKNSLEEQVTELLKANENISKQLSESGDKITELSEKMQAISMQAKQESTQLQNRLHHQESIAAEEKRNAESLLESKESLITKWHQLHEEVTQRANELDNKLLESDMEQSKLNKFLSDLETKLQEETCAKENLLQKLKSLELDAQSRGQANQSRLDELENIKAHLESQVKESDAKLAALSESKISMEKRHLTRFQCYDEKLTKLNQKYLYLKGHPLRNNLKNSVGVGTKLVLDIKKLIDKMNTDKQYKESVKTELVKKILANVRDKLDGMVIESNSLLESKDPSDTTKQASYSKGNREFSVALKSSAEPTPAKKPFGEHQSMPPPLTKIDPSIDKENM